MRYRLLTFAVLAIVTLTGCVGTRMGVSWPTVDLIEMNGEQQIVVAYTDQVAIVSPQNGAHVPLLNPATGEVRRDAENNARNWVLLGHDYEAAQFYTNPIYLDEETFLVADYNSRLLEIDTVTATVKGTIPLTGHVLANILVSDDVLYIPMQAGGVTAMSLDGYEVLWSYHPSDEGVWAEPLLVNDMIIFTSLDHHMYAIDKSGELLWKVDLEGAVSSKPLFANDRLYIGSFNKKFFEVSLDGNIINTYETQNWVWGTPALAEDGILYVADLSGYVHALDSNDNLSVVWSEQVATRGIRSGPLVYQDSVIVASRDGSVYWIDRHNGVILTQKEIEGKPELLSNLMLIEPSESMNIDKPLIIVSTVDTSKLLVAFEVDGLRQPWVYKR